MHRPIDTIEAEMELNRDKTKALRDEMRELLKELAEAKLAEALANPHEWLGLKVRRKRMVWKGERAERGIVTTYDPAKHRGIRNYSGTAGQPFVLSASGLTGYRLTDEAQRGYTAWELDS